MNFKEKEQALAINALLMSFHHEDREAFMSLINDSEDPGSLMMGGIAVLKNMIDALLDMIEVEVDQNEITFDGMVRARSEFLLEVDTED